MNTTILTLAEVRHKGLHVLARELGPADYVRFLQQFESGHGDYTKERQQLLSHVSLEEAIALVKEQESKNS